MKNKIKYVVFLFLPIVFLAVWCGILSYKINSGSEVRIRIRGYDPVDLLSGHYISYQIDWEKTDCSQFENSVCPIMEFNSPARFYVAEKDADELDREVRNQDNMAEVIYSYNKESKPFVKKLLINGKSWKSDK